MHSEDRLRRLQVSMAEAGVHMAAFGPTANMRYLLGFAPHPDERPCLLLVAQQAVRMVVPSLNAEETAAHTEGIELVAWEDAQGPQQAGQLAQVVVAEETGGARIRGGDAGTASVGDNGDSFSFDPGLVPNCCGNVDKASYRAAFRR